MNPSSPATVPPLLRSRAWFLGVLLALAALSQPASAQYSEYEVKAAFLANFTQFAKWPPEALSVAGAPFAIGILGDNPFGGTLEKLVKGQTVSGHKIVIRRGRSSVDLRSCHVVFIAKSEEGRVAEHIAGLQGASILIVGETEQFTSQGGMIGFKMDGDKVRFAINTGAAQRAKLEISSRLLKLARSG